MGSKSKAPAAPDPVQLANAQTQANTKTAQQQQKLNMINTTGPSGSVSYVADPSAPGGYRQVTSLNPAEQQAYDQQNAVYNQALQTAGGQIGRVNEALGQGLNTSGLPALSGGVQSQNLPALQGNYAPSDFSADRAKVEQGVYDRATSFLDPQFARQESSLDAKLAARGLGSMNTDATRTAYQDFNRDRNAAYDQARNSAILAGGQEQSRLLQEAQNAAAFQNAARGQGFTENLAGAQFQNQARSQGLQEQAYMQNLPIQQLQALLGTGSVSMPQGINYTPTQVGQTDVLGANALNQQAQWNRYNAQQQTQNGLMGGLFGLGSAAIGLNPFGWGGGK